MIIERMFQLELTSEGVPVWEIEVPTMADGSPAVARAVRATAKKGAVIAKDQLMTLVIGILFAFDPRMPPQKRRVGLLAPEGEIADKLEAGAVYLGSFYHPGGFGVSVYDFTAATEQIEATPEIVTPQALSTETLQRAMVKVKDIDVSDVKPEVP